QYRVLHGALAPRGILAISFKAAGDALEGRGSVVEETAAGPLICGDDGIRRLFVTNVDMLADEMRDEAYAIQRIVRWSVAHYNVRGEAAEFVGVLAKRH